MFLFGNSAVFQESGHLEAAEVLRHPEAVGDTGGYPPAMWEIG